ncbi:MAG: DUF6867 family protein [Hyphomicrobiaceae bacterium]
MSALFDAYPGELSIFLVLSVVLGGAAATVTGKAIAESWKPYWQLVWYMLLLAGAVRFFHYALFQETLLSLPGYLATLAVVVALALLGHFTARRRQMREQYGWRNV